jgi:hypothetical protein
MKKELDAFNVHRPKIMLCNVHAYALDSWYPQEYRFEHSGRAYFISLLVLPKTFVWTIRKIYTLVE